MVVRLQNGSAQPLTDHGKFYILRTARWSRGEAWSRAELIALIEGGAVSLGLGGMTMASRQVGSASL